MAEDQKPELKPSVKPSGMSGMSRRQFNTLAVGAAASLFFPGLPQKTEAMGNEEQIGLVEGIRDPKKLIAQFERKIINDGLADGEYFSVFLENFSIEHSSDPETARKNLEALDYAFKQCGIGERIVSVIDEEMGAIYPELATEERLRRSSGGTNETLEGVVYCFSGIEFMSRVDIGLEDGEGSVERLKKIVEWVKPMVENKDYDKEKEEYGKRAMEEKRRSGFYENTREVWLPEGDEVADTMEAILIMQGEYLPVAGAGVGAIKPGDSSFFSENALGNRAIVIDRNYLRNAVLQKDSNALARFLAAYVHELGHFDQREYLDWENIIYKHPEDLLRDYEGRNRMLKNFTEKVVKLDAADINGFIYDPGLRIKFSQIQYITDPGQWSVVLGEMRMVEDVGKYLRDHNELVRVAGVDDLFGEEGATRVEIVKGLADSLQLSQNAENFISFNSHTNFAAYAALLKLDEKGLLLDHPELRSAFFNIKRIVEEQVGHATMGPPGGYLGAPNSYSDVTMPIEGATRVQIELTRLSREQYPSKTDKSTELVEFLFNQMPERMEVLARLMGAKNSDAIWHFANEVLESRLT